MCMHISQTHRERGGKVKSDWHHYYYTMYWREKTLGIYILGTVTVGFLGYQNFCLLVWFYIEDKTQDFMRAREAIDLPLSHTLS